MSSAIDDATAFVDPRHDDFLGGVTGQSSAEQQAGWDTAYAANRDLGPEYMGQYGNAADSRLAEIQARAGASSDQLALESRNIGTGGMNAAVNLGNVYGEGASQFGQGAAGALTGAGAQAAALGNYGLNRAASDANAISMAGGRAEQLGTAAQSAASGQAMNLNHTGTASANIGAAGNAAMGGAAAGLQTTGQQAANIGADGQSMIQGAARGIGAAGQLGAQTGRQAASDVAGAGQAGQQSLSALGGQQGRFGMTAAQQGQSFLDERGYQAQMGDANQARGQAQGAAGQLAGIEAQEGPSAAQAQLRSGLNQAQSANLAMARSGKGFGGSASAMSQAANQNAQAGQQAANQSAQLRAQENAAFRQRQAANLGAAGGLQLGAGQQALSREQMLGQQQQASTDANRQAYLQSQGLGLQGLSGQAATEAQARQMALAGQQAAGQFGMQGAGMQLTAEQARAGALTQAAQTGLAGQAQNVAAQQAAMQGIGQGAQLGLQGSSQQMQAQQAAGQLGVAGYGQALQGAGMNIGAAQGAGALSQQGVQAGLAGSAQNIGAIQGAGQVGLQGILGGGALNLQGTTQGAQIGLAGNQAAQSSITQGAQLGMTAEQIRAANVQHSYGLTQGHIANDLQIAGMQAGLAVQNAGFANQMAGGIISTGGELVGAAAASDVNAKTDIVPLDSDDSRRAGQIGGDEAGRAMRTNTGRSKMVRAGDFFGGSGPISLDGGRTLDPNEQVEIAAPIGGTMPRFAASHPDPYGIGFGADQQQKEADDKKARGEKFGAAFSGFGGAMQGGMNPSVNPITGQPWAASDERAKYSVSDKKAKAGEMVDKLDPYAFKYKDPERHGAGRHIGIMAQDLEKSEAGRTVVEKAADGTKMVNTPKLTMLNSAALAQYDDRLAEIEARVKRLGGKAA